MKKGKNGLFFQPPSKKRKEQVDSKDVYDDIWHAITGDAHKLLNQAVAEAFEALR